MLSLACRWRKMVLAFRFLVQEESEDTKSESVNRKMAKKTGQNDKQRSTKYETENWRPSNTNPTRTKNPGWTQVLRKGKQSLLHQWHSSCYSSYSDSGFFFADIFMFLYIFFECGRQLIVKTAKTIKSKNTEKKLRNPIPTQQKSTLH